MHRIFSLTLLLLFVVTVGAQEADVGVPLPDEKAADFEQRNQAIVNQLAAIESLAAVLPGDDETMHAIHLARMDTARANVFREVLVFAQAVIDEKKAGGDTSKFEPDLSVFLDDLAHEAIGAIGRVKATLEIPSETLPPAVQITADRQMEQQLGLLQGYYATLISFVELAPEFQLDASVYREYVVAQLRESAANLSALLDLALRQKHVAHAASATIPDDKDLADRFKTHDSRVRIVASALHDRVSLLARLGLDSAHYRQQLVTATGELTAELLDVDVLKGIVAEWNEAIRSFLDEDLPAGTFRVFVFVLILIAALMVGKLVKLGLNRAFASPKIRISALLERMLIRATNGVVLFIGLLIALSQVGVSLGPVLGGLGIASLVIGFALQDSLSNFVSGMLILFYRPFDVGDFVSAAGVTGLVSHMSLVSTTFRTQDNEVLIVPNNKIWRDVIRNTTARRLRRVDLTFGISYEDDIDRARKVLLETAANCSAVLKEPAPDVRVAELADSSVNLLLRPWVRTEDYWDTRWNLIEDVKKKFDAEGITIPFPQRDLHVIVPTSDKEPDRRDDHGLNEAAASSSDRPVHGQSRD